MSHDPDMDDLILNGVPVLADRGLRDASNVQDALIDILALARQVQDRTETLVSKSQADALFYRAALDHAAIVAVTDVKGNIISVNRKFCEISGYAEDELIGCNHRLLHSGVHDKLFFRDMYRTIACGNIWHGEICNRAKDGSLYWVLTTIVPQRDAKGRLQSYTAIRFDITAQKSAEERLWRLAHIDPLTGVYNRRHFIDHCEALLEQPKLVRDRYVLGFMDLNRFKEINDTYGHDVGDELLKTVAARVQAKLGGRDVVARFGGDEFVFLLDAGRTGENGQRRFAAILNALRQPMMLGGRMQTINASIGYARLATHAGNAQELLRNSDIAVYEAKHNSRNQAVPFSPGMAVAYRRRRELFDAAMLGLNGNAFEVHYQPIVPLADLGIVQLEALLRWHHPEQGLLTASQFAEVFTDQIIATRIGDFVLETIIAQIGAWRSEGANVPQISLNLSAADLQAGCISARLISALENGEISERDISVEITESMLHGAQASIVRNEITRLHAVGIEIVLDNFGREMAPLTVLRDMPISAIKISNSLVADIEHDPRDKALMAHLISLAHALSIKVTAEHIETIGQRILLQQMGCDNIQGFLVSSALSAADVHDWLRALDLSRHIPDKSFLFAAPANRIAA